MLYKDTTNCPVIWAKYSIKVCCDKKNAAPIKNVINGISIASKTLITNKDYIATSIICN